MPRGRAVVAIEVIVGVLFIVAAFLYLTTPARSLPAFFPGYDPAVDTTHTKHAIAAALLGIGAFVLAWFSSGPRSAAK